MGKVLDENFGSTQNSKKLSLRTGKLQLRYSVGNVNQIAYKAIPERLGRFRLTHAEDPPRSLLACAGCPPGWPGAVHGGPAVFGTHHPS